MVSVSECRKAHKCFLEGHLRSAVHELSRFEAIDQSCFAILSRAFLQTNHTSFLTHVPMTSNQLVFQPINELSVEASRLETKDAVEMPDSRNAQAEKPHHYSYLKGFRTEQCQAFAQHKCQQHRPFTCFNWHFQNQRRRRPRLKRDGSFNYSPDVYCTLYDESTGTCANGDECPLLHRNAGDTERRFHLRYYKTTVCNYETDSKGSCDKNGPHCWFAHRKDDLRCPVYDNKEPEMTAAAATADILASAGMSPRGGGGGGGGKEKDRSSGSFTLDDPRWQDHKFVLFYYKTELCRKPPKSCRQGYACPYYHNGKDKRRPPKKFKYRSTPCPSVKHGDEWCEPGDCDKGDQCCYCHTRTEQQFHPEIYKSTKCYDMLQTKTCPRGPFCAFAHKEDELKGYKDALDKDEPPPMSPITAVGMRSVSLSPRKESHSHHHHHHHSHHHPPLSKPRPISRPHKSENEGLVHSAPGNAGKSLLLIQGEREGSSVGSLGSYEGNTPAGAAAMGFGLGGGGGGGGGGGAMAAAADEDLHQQVLVRKQIIAIDNDTSLSEEEKTRRKQSVRLYHSVSYHTSPDMSPASGLNASLTGTPLSASANPGFHPSSHFFPSGSLPDLFDLSTNVQGLNIDDDDVINQMEDLDMREIEKEIGKAASGRTGSVGSSHASSLSSSLSSSFPGPVGSSSAAFPMTPPFGMGQGGYAAAVAAAAAVSAAAASYPSPVHANPFSGRPSSLEHHHPFSVPIGGGTGGGGGHSSSPKHSPVSNPSSQSQAASSSPSALAVNLESENRRLREEISQSRSKVAAWEESLGQARQACEAWKKEATEKSEKVKKLENEMKAFEKEKEEASSSSRFLHCLEKSANLDKVPLSELKEMQKKLKEDLSRIEKAVYHREALKCIKCHEWQRSVVVYPCRHCVLCETCAEGRKECAYCNGKMHRQVTVFIPHNPVEKEN